MATDQNFSASRRAFLKLPCPPESKTIRPPWTDENAIAAACTGCNGCIEACPENILGTDPAGRPVVEFNGGECTFCRKCAEACDANVFDLTREAPWNLVAALQPGCLQDHGISCQLCRDLCPATAIRVDLAKRPFGRLKIDTAVCTGCGACLAACPQDALAIVSPIPAREVA